jgi:hypothetical protein
MLHAAQIGSQGGVVERLCVAILPTRRHGMSCDATDFTDAPRKEPIAPQSGKRYAASSNHHKLAVDV